MASVYLLTGENEVFKRKRIEELVAPFDKENVQNLYAAEHEAGEIFAQCYQSSLFGGRTAVVVRNIGELKDSPAKNFSKSLVRYLDSVNDDVLLILDWNSPSSEAAKKMKDTKSAITEEFKTVYRNGIADYIRRYFLANNVRYDRDVVDFILDMTNESIEDADTVCRNLAAFAGRDTPVTVEDARDMLANASKMTVFDLMDGIFKRSVAPALRALNDLKLNSEPVLMINAILLKTARNAWGLLTVRGSEAEVQNALGVRGYPFKKLKEYERFVNLKYISRIFELVRELDIRAKTMPEEFAFISLENFILTMRD